MDLRKEEEKRFHDELRIDSYAQRWSPELERTIREDPLWSNMKYYSIERSSRQAVLNWFSKECRNKYVLDYCGGNGEDSFYIAEHGAGGVLGIDI